MHVTLESLPADLLGDVVAMMSGRAALAVAAASSTLRGLIALSMAPWQPGETLSEHPFVIGNAAQMALLRARNDVIAQLRNLDGEGLWHFSLCVSVLPMEPPVSIGAVAEMIKVQFSELTALSLGGHSRVTAEVFASLEALTRLRSLDITKRTTISAAAFKSLAKLPQLETLIAPSVMHASDSAIQHLSLLKGLTKLDIRMLMLNGAGVDALKDLTSLKWLRCCCGRVLAGGFTKLAAALENSIVTLALNTVMAPAIDELGAFARCRSLRTLSVESGFLTTSVMEQIALITQLTSLDLRNCSGRIDDITASLSPLVQLQHLSTSRSFNPGRISPMDELAPTLTSLDLFGINCASPYTEVIARLVHLNHLVIPLASTCNPDVVIVRLSSSLKLVTLKLFCRAAPTQQSFDAIANHCNLTMETLEFGSAAVITRSVLQAVARLRALRSLRLTGMNSRLEQEFDDDDFVELAPLATRLTELEVWKGIGDTGAQHIAKLSKLSTLRVRGRQTMSDRGVATLVTLDGLRSLSLIGNFETISMRAVAYLAELPSLTELNIERAPFSPDLVLRVLKSPVLVEVNTRGPVF